MNKNSRFFPFRIVVILLLVATVCLFFVFIELKPLGPLERIFPSTPTTSVTQRFTTLPPGATLPSETYCFSRVRRLSWELRPDNYIANHRVPTAQQIANIAPWGPADGLDPKAEAIQKQITGNFTGTTDEIFQWVACKWGIDEDIIRAQAFSESHWHQSEMGDWTTDRSLCPPGTWNGKGCFQSYGILQIKYIYNSTEWPMSRDDTAFNAEYTYSVIRACYEGLATYLADRIPISGYPRYHAGDLWGCIGRWYSGNWYDQKAIDYMSRVKTNLTNKEWLRSGF